MCVRSSARMRAFVRACLLARVCVCMCVYMSMHQASCALHVQTQIGVSMLRVFVGLARRVCQFFVFTFAIVKFEYLAICVGVLRAICAYGYHMMNEA